MRKSVFGAGNSSADGNQKKFSVALASGSRSTSSRHYVYMLECSDGSIYTGYTTNPARRLAAHNGGTAARYTRSRRPVNLVYLEELASRGEALSREIRLKRLKKGEKLLLCRAYLGLEKHGRR